MISRVKDLEPPGAARHPRVQIWLEAVRLLERISAMKCTFAEIATNVPSRWPAWCERQRSG